MQARLQAASGVRAEAINGKVEAAVGRAAERLATGVAWALDGGPYGARGGLGSCGRPVISSDLRNRAAPATVSKPRRRTRIDDNR